MTEEDKKDIEGFIQKTLDWANDIEGVDKNSIIVLNEYLHSEEFYAIVDKQRVKAKNQKEFNYEMTLIVRDKIRAIIQVSEEVKLDKLI